MRSNSGTGLTVVAIALGVLLVGGVPNLDTSGQADFAFRFSYGICVADELDTFTGVFTRGLGMQRIVSIPLALPKAQMNRIYQAIETSRFFNLPGLFTGFPVGATEATTTTPAWKYRLDVRSAGRTHSVTWEDKTKPTTDEAGRLREMFAMMMTFIREHPDVKRLPMPTVGCA